MLAGPSGVGKSTLRSRLLTRLRRVAFSVSCTTRPAREGEQEGRDYHYLSDAEFQRLIDAGAFLEWARVFGHSYGTLRQTVSRQLEAGRDVLLEIDVQGAAQIRRRARTIGTPVHYIFVLPPSLEALAARLGGRGTEEPTERDRRLQGNLSELAHASRFEYLVINREVNEAAGAIARFIHAARAASR